jgi:hypothetical protein
LVSYWTAFLLVFVSISRTCLEVQGEKEPVKAPETARPEFVRIDTLAAQYYCQGTAEKIWPLPNCFYGKYFNLDCKSGKASFRLLHSFRLREGKIELETVWFDYDELKNQLT